MGISASKIRGSASSGISENEGKCRNTKSKYIALLRPNYIIRRRRPSRTDSKTSEEINSSVPRTPSFTALINAVARANDKKSTSLYKDMAGNPSSSAQELNSLNDSNSQVNANYSQESELGSPPSSSITDKGQLVFEANSDKEYDRQARQHYLLKRALGDETDIPLTSPCKILDLGCGVGFWAYEMAREHPEYTVVGLQTHNTTPEANAGNPITNAKLAGLTNLSCVQGEVCDPLPFPPNSFDFVYQRDVGSIMPTEDWPLLLEEVYRVLRHGGYLRIVDHELDFRNPGPILTEVNEFSRKAFAAIGIELHHAANIHTHVTKAGFADVNSRIVDIPIGEWPAEKEQREIGFLYLARTKAVVRSISKWFMSERGMTKKEFDKLAELAFGEFESGKSQARWHIITARKPMPEQERVA